MTISAQERAALAERVRVNEQFLYQCLTGRRCMDAKEAVRVERESHRRVLRWQLRQADWHEIWPELAGTDGYPSLPSPAAAAA